jgi:hypothetical protein
MPGGQIIDFIAGKSIPTLVPGASVSVRARASAQSDELCALIA